MKTILSVCMDKKQKPVVKSKILIALLHSSDNNKDLVEMWRGHNLHSKSY